MLIAFLFLDEYYILYEITNHSKVTYYGDNLEVVTKLRNIQSNPNYYDEYIKTTYHDTIQLLKFYIPSFIEIHHVRSHQDEK